MARRSVVTRVNGLTHWRVFVSFAPPACAIYPLDSAQCVSSASGLENNSQQLVLLQRVFTDVTKERDGNHTARNMELGLPL